MGGPAIVPYFLKNISLKQQEPSGFTVPNLMCVQGVCNVVSKGTLFVIIDTSLVLIIN
jgi:hypothetical protein